MNVIEITNNFRNKVSIIGTEVDAESLRQVNNLANYYPYRYQKICVMPNVHPGKGVPVGTTLTFENVISPSMVGIDPGRGTLALPIGYDISNILVKKEFFEFKDEYNGNLFINCPSINKLRFISPEAACRYNPIDLNGFVEVAQYSKTGEYWLIIHYGNGSLGEELYRYYLSKTSLSHPDIQRYLKELINTTPPEEREYKIAQYYEYIRPLNDEKQQGYLSGKYFDDFLNDVDCLTDRALFHRMLIARSILVNAGLSLNFERAIDTVQNGIDRNRFIVRKGAVDASKNKEMIILLNSEDGALICRGKGNADWNYSAPAGAGRIMSRTDAKKVFSKIEISDPASIYKDSPNNPLAFRSSRYIMDVIQPSVEIIGCLKTVKTYHVKQYYPSVVFNGLKPDVFHTFNASIISSLLNGPDSPYRKIIERTIRLLSFGMCEEDMRKMSRIEYTDGVNLFEFRMIEGRITKLLITLFIVEIAETRRIAFTAPQAKEIIKYTNIPPEMDGNIFNSNKLYLMSLF